MNLKRNRTILLCLLVLLIPLAYFSHKLALPSLSLLPLVGWLILYLVAVHLLWRCPHCDGYLGKVNKLPAHCPHCGEELMGGNAGKTKQ